MDAKRAPSSKFLQPSRAARGTPAASAQRRLGESAAHTLFDQVKVERLTESFEHAAKRPFSPARAAWESP
jgi:hypothetical protein